jgi:hypothetical protein
MNQNGLRAIPTLRASARRALFQTHPGGVFVEPEGSNQILVVRPTLLFLPRFQRETAEAEPK